MQVNTLTGEDWRRTGGSRIWLKSPAKDDTWFTQQSFLGQKVVAVDACPAIHRAANVERLAAMPAKLIGPRASWTP